MKKCSKCLENKPLFEFRPRKDRGTLSSHCRACGRAASNRWKANNKERAKVYTQKWRDRNKERLRQWSAEYRASNPAYRAAARRRTLEWAKANPEKVRARNGAYIKQLEVRAKALIRSAHKRAIKRGRESALTVEWLLGKLQAGVCEATGIRFEYQPRHPFSPSLDRIDCARGYTSDNVRVVVFIHNCARGNWGDEVLPTYARAVLGRL